MNKKEAILRFFNNYKELFTLPSTIFELKGILIYVVKSTTTNKPARMF